MFGWFKKKDDVKETNLNIAEPVLSFVKAFKENPNRFKFNIEEEGIEASSQFLYHHDIDVSICVFDSLTEERFSVRGFRPYSFRYYAPAGGYTYEKLRLAYYPSFLTRDEVQLIKNCVIDYFKARCNRYEELKNIRKDRERARQDALSEVNKRKERQRLIGVYCVK